VDLRQTLTSFDVHLIQAGLRLDAVVVAGTALNLLGIVSRSTDDCDTLHPLLPAAVVAASKTFAAVMRAKGAVLSDNWLNNGPVALAEQLPGGWLQRLEPAFSGSAIVLRCPARSDLLLSKLFTLCDRGLDLGDCLALAPTPEELRDLRPWVEQQDANPDWPAHVEATFVDLGRRLGHGL
jgi:hypothetical protein